MNLNYVRHTIFLSHVYMKMHLDAFLVGNQMLNLIVSLWKGKTFKIQTSIFKPHLLVDGLFKDFLRALNNKTCHPKKSLLSLWGFKLFRVT